MLNRLEAKKAIIKFQKEFSKDFHDIFTPFELCDEILDKINNIDYHINILIMFNLEFIYCLKERFGINGLKNVSFLTPCNEKKKLAIAMGIKENNVYLYSYKNKKITNEKNMPKFDVVIGNPPFQEPSKDEKRKGKSSMSANKLWMRFIILSLSLLKEDGYLSFIIPSNWISPNNLINKDLKKLNIIDVNISKNIIKYFNGVGGNMNFSTLLLQNSLKKNIPVFTFDDNIKKQIDILSMNIVPIKSSNYLDFSIMQKIINKGKENNFVKMNWKREDYAKYYKDSINKVYIPMTKSISFDVFFNNKNTLDSCYTFIPKNTIEGKIITHNLNLKLYKRIRWIIRPSMAMISNIRYLYIPTNKKMNDKELYNYFKLSKEEIQFIES